MLFVISVPWAASAGALAFTIWTVSGESGFGMIFPFGGTYQWGQVGDPGNAAGNSPGPVIGNCVPISRGRESRAQNPVNADFALEAFDDHPDLSSGYRSRVHRK